MYEFQAGDPVRGKDSELRGVVLKVLDKGWLMVRETEFDMEVNVHSDEVVLSSMPTDKLSYPLAPKEEQPSRKVKSQHIDLHLESIPVSIRKRHTHPAEAQLEFLRKCLHTCLQQGCSQLEIIHGKGSGNLHKRILELLRNHAQVRYVEPLKAALEKPHGIRVLFR